AILGCRIARTRWTWSESHTRDSGEALLRPRPLLDDRWSRDPAMTGGPLGKRDLGCAGVAPKERNASAMAPKKVSGCRVPVFFLVAPALAVAALYWEWLRTLFVVAFFGVILLWIHREPPDPDHGEDDAQTIRLRRSGDSLPAKEEDGFAPGQGNGDGRGGSA